MEEPHCKITTDFGVGVQIGFFGGNSMLLARVLVCPRDGHQGSTEARNGSSEGCHEHLDETDAWGPLWKIPPQRHLQHWSLFAILTAGA